MWAKLFLDDPRTVEENYREHAVFAGRFIGQLFVAALCALIHALIPGRFEKTTSKNVAATMLRRPVAAVNVSLSRLCGPAGFLSEIIADPVHSLIDQSRNAEECKTNLNADGFGVALYGHRPEPGLYRDVYPAWSDPNLRALSEQVKSALFLAHVRALTRSVISHNNCYPFAVDRCSLMHNGQIDGFVAAHKAADMLIPDTLYHHHHRRGSTDSEAFSLVASGNRLVTDPMVRLHGP